MSNNFNNEIQSFHNTKKCKIEKGNFENTKVKNTKPQKNTKQKLTIYEAITSGDIEKIKKSSKKEKDMLPLTWAIIENQQQCFDYLFDKKKKFPTNYENYSSKIKEMLMKAALSPNPHFVKRLSERLSFKTNWEFFKYNPDYINMAIENGFPKTVETMMNVEIDVAKNICSFYFLNFNLNDTKYYLKLEMAEVVCCAIMGTQYEQQQLLLDQSYEIYDICNPVTNMAYAIRANSLKIAEKYEKTRDLDRDMKIGFIVDDIKFICYASTYAVICNCFPIFEMLFNNEFKISPTEHVKIIFDIANSIETEKQEPYLNRFNIQCSKTFLSFVKRCYEKSNLILLAHFNPKNDESLLNINFLPTDILKIVYKLIAPFNSSWKIEYDLIKKRSSHKILFTK